MSTPPKSPGRRGDGKAALPKRFSLPKGGLPLGHCKKCNVLSLMWSAIGNLQYKRFMLIRPCLRMVFSYVSVLHPSGWERRCYYLIILIIFILNS